MVLTHAAFDEQGGQVVIDAERAHAVVARDGHTWVASSTVAGSSGDGDLAVEPDSGRAYTSGYENSSPEARYVIDFATTGTYYVWARLHVDDGGDDSLHAGMDGVAASSADKIRATSYGAWVWTNATMDGRAATLAVSTAGLHTVNLWAREDGLRIDRLLLTRDPGFAPSGAGPDESPPVGGAVPTAMATATSTPPLPDPNPTVVTAPPFAVHDGTVAIEAEDFHLHAPRAGHGWTLESGIPGASSAAYLSVAPDIGWHLANTYATASPELQYQIEFDEAGTYFVWTRVLAGSGGSDSLHIGLNGTELTSGRNIDVIEDGTWRWTNRLASGGVASITIPAAGVYPISVWAREDGLRFDRLILTADAAFTPTGFGPAGGDRAGDPTATPTMTPTADAPVSPTVAAQATETVTATETPTVLVEPSPEPTSTPTPEPPATSTPEPEPTATPTEDALVEPPPESGSAPPTESASG